MRTVLALSLAVLVTACTACAASQRAAVRDPPVLVPWKQVGDVRLGEPFKHVEHEYGTHRRYYGHRLELHGRDGRVNDIGFSSPYYRTKTGFGVGSEIPFGPCVKTWTHRCGHRWHGFVWNEDYKERVCGCWAKVGSGRRSLRPTGANFLRRWILVYVRHGRVTSVYLSLHFVD